jgi:hypothetical protein
VGNRQSCHESIGDVTTEYTYNCLDQLTEETLDGSIRMEKQLTRRRF